MVRSFWKKADSSWAVTVGAWEPDRKRIAEYSSRGPTDDGRHKPDLAAPTAVPCASYPDGFTGTSASAPHVAGALALLRQLNPSSGAEQLREHLMKSLRPVPDAGGWVARTPGKA